MINAWTVDLVCHVQIYFSGRQGEYGKGCRRSLVDDLQWCGRFLYFPLSVCAINA